MLVYISNLDEFSDKVKRNQLPDILEENIRDRLGHGISPSEKRSWRNSLGYVCNAFDVAKLSSDTGIAVEFQIPLTSKRVDVLVSGTDESGRSQVVIVELKAWESAEATDKSGIVRTKFSGVMQDTTHPSYQAWSYATFIADYNEAVQTKDIELHPCSYLHNCSDASVLRSEQYESNLEQAPLFLKQEVDQLAEFLNRYVAKGDRGKSLYDIDQGRVRPSKQLIEHLTSLLEGNDEFILLDEQKVVAETILSLNTKAQTGSRQVLIVEGGPGTGKSVLAINLLGKLTESEQTVQYVTRNTTPRKVIESKLTQTYSQTRVSNLFKSSGNYVKASERSVDVLLVDEAHRLSPKSGFQGNLGENQVKEIIHASDLSVFFLDENQQVLFKDIGTHAEIARWGDHFGAEVSHIELTSQFRCNGSNGYLAWLDDVLQIRSTANKTLGGINYDFQVFDSPTELYETVAALDGPDQIARVVAGYCWEWVSKGKEDQDVYDIELKGGFRKKWNLASQGDYWLLDPESISEIGSIHKTQGLELEYIGVIVGPDLLVRDGMVFTDVTGRAKGDQTVRGYKTAMKQDPELTTETLDRVIKNTYRTLMTRGMKGCYVYCVDEETNEYFKNRMTGFVPQ